MEAKAQRSLGVRLSEGPALRVRIERSCACRDIAFPPGAWRIGPWPKRGNIWVWRDAFLPGVRSPPLRGVDHPRGDGLARKRPGIALMAFSRRDALCASALQGLTHAEAFHYTIWVDRWPVARCRHASAKLTHSLRACGARPSAGWTTQGEMALRGNARG